MADTKPLQAADKLAFLLALVPYLMDRERVSVEEAARHFGVSAKQVREAVNLIAVSGIPGSTGTYQHGDLFDVAWDDFLDNDQIVLTHMVAIDDSPRFSGREAAALIAGLQYLSALPENADREAISTLMAKLARGASAAPPQVAVAAAQTDQTLSLAREAVAEGVQIEFDYLNARGEQERRRVDPVRVESLDADWYLRGWCHMRQAPRTFRLDRISNPVKSSQPSARPVDEVPLAESLFEGSADDLLVTARIAQSAVPLLADYLEPGTATPPSDGAVTATIRVSHVHALKRLVAGLPGAVTVTAPVEARDAVAEWAAAGLGVYTKPEDGGSTMSPDTL